MPKDWTTRRMSDVKGIPLRNRSGDVVAYAWVDTEDYERVMAEGRWSLSPRGYAYRRGPIGTNVHGEIKLHRFIMGAQPGDPIVDHRDRNPLNDTKSNLRYATNQQNSTNQGSRGGSSKYRGVWFDKALQKWRVKHHINGKAHCAGSYATEEEANDAAIAWRAEHMPFHQEVVDA